MNLKKDKIFSKSYNKEEMNKKEEVCIKNCMILQSLEM